MFSKTKENILFTLIVIAIIAMTMKSFTLKPRSYDGVISDIEEKIVSSKAEISAMKAKIGGTSQTASENIAMDDKEVTVTGIYGQMIQNLEKKIKACETAVSSLNAEISEISQTASEKTSIRNLEEKLGNHRHNKKNGKVIF